MKLSKIQFYILRLLADGWELGKDETFMGNFMWRIQKGGIGKGGELKNINRNTANKLRQLGFIEPTTKTNQFPKTHYKLTDYAIDWLKKSSLSFREEK